MLNRFELPAHGADKPTGHSRDSGGLDETALETDLHIENALKSVEGDDAAGALRSMNRAIVDAPDDRLAECYSLRGYIHYKLGDFERAEGDCDEAIERQSRDPQTCAWRAAARPCTP